MANIHLLIIDDDHHFYTVFREQYRSAYVFEYASHFERGLDLIRREKFDAVLLDLQFSPKNYEYGLSDILPRAVRLAKGRFPIIVASSDDRPNTLSKALKAGASLLLSKSEYEPEQWDVAIRRVIRKFKDPTAHALPADKRQSVKHDGFIANSPAMEAIKLTLRTLVNYPHVPILFEGESGVGKEAAVRYLHAVKNNPELPLKIVNLAALSKDLIASELFGHAKGAFTGAIAEKAGYFESAKNGTLLLDEIGEISLEMQTQLLTVLGNRTFQRVGSTEDIRLEAQLVFATNANLEEAVKQGGMRADFYARISNRRIHIPPLCDRREEIIPLIEYFLPRTFNHPEHPLFGKAPLACFTPEAIQILVRYDWPTNIRQLQGVLQDLVIEAEARSRSIIDKDLIPQQFKFPGRTMVPARTASVQSLTGPKSLPGHGWPPKKVGVYLELQEIDRALKESGGRKDDAARSIGLKTSDNIRSRIIACQKNFPDLLDAFPALKNAYKI